jgi:hypothetical protein
MFAAVAAFSAALILSLQGALNLHGVGRPAHLPAFSVAVL